MKRLVSTFQDFRGSIPFRKWCKKHGHITEFHFCNARYPELFVPGVDDDTPAIPTITPMEKTYEAILVSPDCVPDPEFLSPARWRHRRDRGRARGHGA